MFSATDFFENLVKTMNHLPREKQNQTTITHTFAYTALQTVSVGSWSLGSPSLDLWTPHAKPRAEDEIGK